MNRYQRTKLRYRAPKRKRGNKFLIFLLVLIFGGATFYFLNQKPTKEAKSETLVSATEEKKTKPIIPVAPKVNISNEVNQILLQYPNVSASVTLIDLNSGTKTNIGNNNTYTAASTTKVLSAICLLQKVESGKTTLEKLAGSYNLKWHLKQMINQSNNGSWDVINREVGYQNLINCARNNGLSSYNFYNNTVRGEEMAELLQHLDQGKLLTPTNTTLLLSHMQKTNYEYLIPSGLNASVVFYHKYGALGTNLHDIAIIKAKNPFVLAIYTTGNSISNEQRYALFKALSQKIYSYQNSN